MATNTAANESADKDFYDNEAVGSEDDHRRFMEEIGLYFATYSDRLNRELAGTAGVVAELGAGSCGLSCHASRLDNVSRVYSCDISAVRMNKMLDLSARIVVARRDKITTIPSDFNQRLPFDDGALDAVLFDAALHHTRSMWGLIAECARVLRPGGILIAQRESYLSPLRAGSQLRFLMQSPEVAAQVSENMYLRSQYEYYLGVNGFEVEFHPVSRGRLKKSLRLLNGSLFTDGVLFCHRRT